MQTECYSALGQTEGYPALGQTKGYPALGQTEARLSGSWTNWKVILLLNKLKVDKLKVVRLLGKLEGYPSLGQTGRLSVYLGKIEGYPILNDYWSTFYNLDIFAWQNLNHKSHVFFYSP